MKRKFFFVYIYIYVKLFFLAYIYIYIYTHTHTHIYIYIYVYNQYPLKQNCSSPLESTINVSEILSKRDTKNIST